jgi:hypothetical protein
MDPQQRGLLESVYRALESGKWGIGHASQLASCFGSNLQLPYVQPVFLCPEQLDPIRQSMSAASRENTIP